MPRKKPQTIRYKRKREGKTNYRKRVNALMAQIPRLVVRFTNQKIIVQLISFKTTGDVILVGADSSSLRKLGWNYSFKNMPAAYLIGYSVGKKAIGKDIQEAILDLGFKPPIKGNKVYACLKGALDAGLKVNCSEDIFPSKERISGKHIQDYAAKLKEDQKIFNQKFSKLLKNNTDPTNLVGMFEQIKEKINQSN